MTEVPHIPDGLVLLTLLPTEGVPVPRIVAEFEAFGMKYGYSTYGPSPEQAWSSNLDLHIETLRQVTAYLAEVMGELFPEMIDLYRDVCYWNVTPLL